MDLAKYAAERANRSVRFRRAQRNEIIRSKLLSTLFETRRLRGFTQTTVAAAMETTQSAISELESRSVDPRLSTLQRYASAVGLELRLALVEAIDVLPAVSLAPDLDEPYFVFGCSWDVPEVGPDVRVAACV